MILSRRAFLGMAAFHCAYCLDAARAFGEGAPQGADTAPGHGAAPHWSYEGDTGPAHWGELSPDFKTCQLGLQQTPIDLANAVKSNSPGKVELDYRSTPLRILNNGHTIQVNAEPGSACILDGKRYELLQFHFHHPSEHLLSGKPFDLECHLVHRAASGGLAVLGVFVKPGAANPALQPIWDAMPDHEGAERNLGGAYNPAALVPIKSAYFRYLGSLTTPPCSEGLIWTVFKDPIAASPEQIRRFAALFPNNARPVQSRNGRPLIEVN